MNHIWLRKPPIRVRNVFELLTDAEDGVALEALIVRLRESV